MLSRDGKFTMSVLSGNRTLPEYYYKGDIFIIGRPGEAYQITLENRSPRRAYAVLTVDGLCAIDGRELLDAGQGYILEPYTPLTVHSWRFFNDRCPPFRFGRLPAGFENEMDEPGNPGVIRACIFYEQMSPIYSSNWTAQMGYAKKGDDRRGWGTSKKGTMVRQQFAKESSPISIMVIQYETEEILRNLGVFTSPKP